MSREDVLFLAEVLSFFFMVPFLMFLGFRLAFVVADWFESDILGR